ncbi:MAG: helix-turn-helix domain-containing protein [Deltaproteobacteria bacterium]|jgi:hypothetical protein|nr:helix-turn-helix domain-containing protein [Deltaproteobacteria bacterium]
MSQAVTHKDLARKLKVSETTIKSYRRKFAECIPVASKGKPIRFLPEAVAVCTRIRDLFDLGMSVEEVRARLAQEFTWISLVGREEPEAAPAAGGMPQEFTIALSNLAKSMVTLLQQQSAIMDRMDKLETVFGDTLALGAVLPQEGAMKAADFKAMLEDLQAYLRNALMPLQQLQRLNEVVNVAEVLHQAAGSMVDAAQIMRSLAKSQTPEGGEAPAKLLRFPTTASQQAQREQAGSSMPPMQPVPQDPPRAFLLKPMVVRTVDGAYIGAGGKSRGRFTLNDFKALLVYGRQPGEHFSLHWEQAGADWIATLTQPQSEKPGKWRMQFKEAVSQSGVGIVELVRFNAHEEDVHPAEFCAFVAELAGS